MTLFPGFASGGDRKASLWLCLRETIFLAGPGSGGGFAAVRSEPGTAGSGPLTNRISGSMVSG